MTIESAALRQAAGALLALADQLEGKVQSTQAMTTYNGQSVTVQEAYAAMTVEFANRLKPHELRVWGTDTPLPEDAGNNLGVPRAYDTHKALWLAAQRGDPLKAGGPPVQTGGVNGWPGPDGKAFRIEDYQKKGPQAVLDAIVWLLANSPVVATVEARLPHNADGTLAEPQLEPISR